VFARAISSVFPARPVFGLAGVAIWPLYLFGVTATYSGRSHALVQTFGGMLVRARYIVPLQ
jgi:hypothetical protein